MSLKMDFGHRLLHSLLWFLLHRLVALPLFRLVKFDMACRIIQYMYAKHNS